MDLQAVVIAAAALGLIVNTLAVLGVAWKGGNLLGRMDSSIGVLSAEVGKLRDARTLDTEILTRAVAQLDALEQRVQLLEERRKR